MSQKLDNPGELGVLSDELERVAEHTDADRYELHTHNDGTFRVELIYHQPNGDY